MKFTQLILSVLLAAALQSCATNPSNNMNVANNQAAQSAAGVDEEEAFLYRDAAMSGMGMHAGMGGGAAHGR